MKEPKQSFVPLFIFILSFLAAFSSAAFAKDVNLKSIVVAFPNNVEFDAGGKKKRPVVLRIVDSVHNNRGKLVIPKGARVEAVLVPVGTGKQKGTMIVAKNLVMNGQSYPLNATASTIIPANKIPRRSRMEQAANYSSSFARFSPMYTSFTGGKESSDYLRNTLIFQGIGAFAGYLSPRSILASRIPQGSEHVLHLQQALSLDTSENIPIVANDSSTPQQ